MVDAKNHGRSLVSLAYSADLISGSLLSCGVHKCPQYCHKFLDHSKTRCSEILKTQCVKGHPQSWRCYEKALLSCLKCEKEQEESRKKQQKAFEAQQRRELIARDHLKAAAEIQEQIEAAAQRLQDARLSNQREDVISQLKIDLANTKAQEEKASKIKEKSSVLPVQAPSSSVQEMITKTSGSTPSSDTECSTDSAKYSDAKTQPAIKVDVPAAPSKVSQSKCDWERQKETEGAGNSSIDKIMEMIGLEEVKRQILDIKDKIETSVRQQTDLKGERFGVIFLGNPGTGKTTVARHYAKFLTTMGVLDGEQFVETAGSRLANGGVAEAKKHIDTLLEAGGGVFFLDEAYQLTEGHNYGGKAVLDFLLAEIENQVGRIVFILAGYSKQMESFFAHNPGFASRMPYTLRFEDYEDSELLQMLQYHFEKRFGGKMSVEGGLGGLYIRIVVQRLGTGRGRDGFGNARALENVFSNIRERQAARVSRQRRKGLKPDDFLTTKEDLIGPEPSKAAPTSVAWKKLQELTGLASVKASIQSLFDMYQTNYEFEILERPLLRTSLNRVFLGSPGTGKTTVAKLYGKCLADMGLLSNGEGIFICTKPAR
jgi:DNA polymerase III delta prime subunit